jgi:hypothetical protein
MPIAQINGHDMYYEVHGDGPPAVYIGGWDTFAMVGVTILREG